MATIAHSVERKAVKALLDHFYDNLADKNVREKTMFQLVDLFQKYYGKDSAETAERFKERDKNPDDRFVKLLNSILDESDPEYAKKLILNLGYEAALRGTKQIRKNREKYGCNIPWLILFDPTDACNMHCAGCWSGTYGHKNNLTYEDMNKIVTQGKELGTYFYMMTGGEPTVRKNDILRLAEEHNDCYFALFSNSTLIDDELCKEVVRLGNISFILSVEGSEETNDARRGEEIGRASCRERV